MLSSMCWNEYLLQKGFKQENEDLTLTGQRGIAGLVS